MPRKTSELEEKLLIHIDNAGIHGWERECSQPWSHTNRRFRADFCFPEHRVSVDAHGATHVQGGHTRGVGFADDRLKSNLAQLAGWKHLEATKQHIDNGFAVSWITQALGGAQSTAGFDPPRRKKKSTS